MRKSLEIEDLLEGLIERAIHEKRHFLSWLLLLAHTEALNGCRTSDSVDANGPVIREIGGPMLAAAAVLQQGWRTIETAPRDGTPVDLWDSILGHIPDAYWGHPRHVAPEDRVGIALSPPGWCDEDGYIMAPSRSEGLPPERWQPTHWHRAAAPLPTLEETDPYAAAVRLRDGDASAEAWL